MRIELILASIAGVSLIAATALWVAPVKRVALFELALEADASVEGVSPRPAPRFSAPALFDPVVSRIEPAETVERAAPARPAVPILMGITRTGEGPVAWLSLNGSASQRVAAGSRIGAWDVVAVSDTRARLRHNAEEIELSLFGGD